MKRLLFGLLLVLHTASYAQTKVKDLLIANTISELKSRPVSATAVVFVLGKNTTGDGYAGTYFFDATDNTTAEDMTNLNTILSTTTSAGRWKRLAARTTTLPGGYLSVNGAKREYFVNGTTDANGQISINLTLEGTSGGTAIFNNAPMVSSILSTTISQSSDATAFYLKSLSADFKVAVIQVYKPNNQTLNLVGLVTLNILPIVNVGAGIGQRIKIEGIYQ